MAFARTKPAAGLEERLADHLAAFPNVTAQLEAIKEAEGALQRSIDAIEEHRQRLAELPNQLIDLRQAHADRLALREIGEGSEADVRAAAEAIDDALARSAAGVPEALRRLADERRDVLSEAHENLCRALQPWTVELKEVSTALEEEAARLQYLAGRAWSAANFSTGAGWQRFAGKGPEPAFTMPPAAEAAQRQALRAFSTVTRI